MVVVDVRTVPSLRCLPSSRIPSATQGVHMPLEASDVLAIQQLYAAYNIAADRGDGKAFGGCFAPDGVFDIVGLMRADSFDALAEFAQSIPANAPGSRHIASNILVEGD